MTRFANKPEDGIRSVRSAGTDSTSLSFVCSAFLFRIGLALLTFEQIRPAFDIQLSDYCFFASLFLLVFQPRALPFRQEQIKVLLPGGVVLLGCVLSIVNGTSITGSLATLLRLLVLFGVFAPLSIFFSKNIRKNMLYITTGIFINCVVTIIQGTVFPGIVEVLSINPTRPDISDVGRFQGLTSHPNIIGLAAGLAILIGLGFLSFEEYEHLRGRMIVVMGACSIAALMSGSRALFVALLPALTVFAIAQGLRPRRIIRMLLAAALIWGTTAYIAPSVVSQFGARFDASGVDISSDYGRLMSALLALSEIAQRPVLGWGIDHFNEAGLTEVPWTGEVVGVHNTFLKYWHGAGIVGAVGFLLLFAIPARLAWRSLRSTFSARAAHMLAIGLGCIVYLFVVSNLGPFDYNRFLYIPLFIIGGFSVRTNISAVQEFRRAHIQPRVYGSSLGAEIT